MTFELIKNLSEKVDVAYNIISRVHTLKSKPFPIQITLIRMTFHGMDSYFEPESRLFF